MQVLRADHASSFTRSHGGTELGMGTINYDLREIPSTFLSLTSDLIRVDPWLEIKIRG